MITTRNLHKEIPSTSGEILRFIGGSALDSSLTIVMENEHAANSMTYKIQTSSDGETWVDKALPIAPSGTQTNFVIGPESAHTLKLANDFSFLRIMAYGTLQANIGLMWYTKVAIGANSYPTILA